MQTKNVSCLLPDVTSMPEMTVLSQLKRDSTYLVTQFQLRSVAARLPLRCLTFSSSVASCTQYINLLAYSRGNGELSSVLDGSVALARVLVEV